MDFQKDVAIFSMKLVTLNLEIKKEGLLSYQLLSCKLFLTKIKLCAYGVVCVDWSSHNFVAVV